MIRASTIRRIARFAGACLLLSLAVGIVLAKAQAAAPVKEPFPTEAMPAGAGYVLNQPEQAGRWEISRTTPQEAALSEPLRLGAGSAQQRGVDPP
jgi:hypothetical protein